MSQESEKESDSNGGKQIARNKDKIERGEIQYGDQEEEQNIQSEYEVGITANLKGI